MTTLTPRRSAVVLRPDATRVVARPYLPSETGAARGTSRAQRLVDRVLALPDADIEPTLQDVRTRFTDRHVDLDEVLEESYARICALAEVPRGLPRTVRSLLAAYFVHEYSIEAAALTNPSIVAAPDQAGAPHGWLRVIISLRAVGEGHISSIELRTGMVGPGGEVRIDPPGPPLLGHRYMPLYDKAVFIATLHEVIANGGEHGDNNGAPSPGHGPSPADLAMAALPDRFTMEDLEESLLRLRLPGVPRDAAAQAKATIHWLAASNYELAFPAQSHLSQRVMFPAGPSESHGMEDARLVRFTRDDGSAVYYATYTAYDGFHVLPQLIETRDFSTFRIATLTGPAARNKGIAIFPRKLGGRYVALARSDAENNFLMWSDHVRVWHESERIQVPVRPWELMQIGNSGAPIETEAGWLVITHGVGPMRTYALGAILLDAEDPRQVIGHLPDPLLLPEGEERDGYVPNVVYSCGQIVHDGTLVLAYGASDTVTRFATVDLDAVLSALTTPPS